MIHYEDSYTGIHTHLLDFTADTSSFSDPDLTVGKTWVAPYSNVSLSISSATSSALDVNVFYGPIPCVEAAPTVAISPSNPSAYAGADVSYDVSVANNDTNSCSSRSFDVASLLPDGWPTALSQTS